jgi:aryl-alcohol dehydrogenase-like predicted oxidoreductase
LYDLERKDATPIREQLEIISDLVKAGKIRSFGLSNETPYGVTAFCKTAELLNLQKPSCVQNAYNLLVRNDYESGMLEACSPTNNNMVKDYKHGLIFICLQLLISLYVCAYHRQGLLAYSPLAGGALTGKYLDPRLVAPEAR